MYIPAAFANTDLAEQHGLIRARPLGTLVSVGPDGLEASHLPFLLDATPAPGILRAHLARANQHWRVLDGAAVLAVFHGVDAYVTPGWYPSKQRHGRVVPTWNYIALHVHGRARIIDDAAWLSTLITRLTDSHEAARSEPWEVTDAPADFIAAQIRGIVGLEIAIERIEAKWKLSQNRDAADRAGVADGLLARGDTALAALIPRD